MADTIEPDLTAMEGPDDWVSLFLDGAKDNILNDLEVRAQLLGQDLRRCRFVNLADTELALQMSDFLVNPPVAARHPETEKAASVAETSRSACASFHTYRTCSCEGSKPNKAVLSALH